MPETKGMVQCVIDGIMHVGLHTGIAVVECKPSNGNLWVRLLTPPPRVIDLTFLYLSVFI